MAVKLNEEKVRQIMMTFHYEKQGRVASELMQEIADRFEVDITTVSRIINRKVWADVWRPVIKPVTAPKQIDARYATRSGQGNPNSKLTEEKVREIIRLYNKGVSMSELGRLFGVSGVTIHHIINGKLWKQVPR